MIHPDNIPKQKKYYKWLDSPMDSRSPRTQIELADEMGIGNSTLTLWHKDRPKNRLQPVRDIANTLGEALEFPADKSDGISDNEKLALARKVYKDAMDSNATASEKELAVKMLGMLIAKTEETHKYVITDEAEERIAQRAVEIQLEFRRNGGTERTEDSLQTEPYLLSE